MQSYRHLIPAAAIAAVFFSSAQPAAAQSMRPGLWEISNKIQSGNGQTAAALAAAQKELANMPPEQRKMIEGMLAKQGVGMSVSGDGVKITHCVTKEMADRKELPTGQQGDCTSSNTPVPGGMNVSFSCVKPPSSGTGQVKFQGDSAYTMTMDVNSTVSGRPEKMTVHSVGRLLSPVCPAGK
ncbi:DUF3617 domain-containing protein [Pseudoduganella sp. LjRoot289]|uniref:DUF3617 domain-containing protein n=1 Tax=Pseudoduganella sp. LjRoot289 TaxID=3342314 RepID=UPI003ECF3874